MRSSDQDKQRRVLALGLFTNRGRSFLATAPTESKADKKYSKDGVTFEQVEVVHFDGPVANGTFKGFFGRSDDEGVNDEGAVWRLGIIWGRSSGPETADTGSKPLGLSSIASMVIDSHNPQSGIREPATWDSGQANYVDRSEVTFNPAYSEPPLMLCGIRHLDAMAQVPLHLDVRNVALTGSKAAFAVRTVEARAYKLSASWLTIPKTDKHIESGVYEFLGDEPTADGSWLERGIAIPFSKPFSEAPVVLVWLCEIATTGEYYSAWAYANQITADRMTVRIQKQAASGKSFTGVRVGWLAFVPKECPNIQSGTIDVTSAPFKSGGRMKFPKEFKTTPAVFMALRYFDSGAGKNFRLYGQFSKVKEDGFEYECGTWSGEKDHDIKRVGYNWIAVT